MQKMKLFIDTHDRRNGTFPQSIGKEAFGGVFEQYAKACVEEGVVVVNAMVNAAEGRMLCLNMAPNPEAIRRAHEKVGLAFDSNTEVTTASPGDIYFNWK